MGAKDKLTEPEGDKGRAMSNIGDLSRRTNSI